MTDQYTITEAGICRAKIDIVLTLGATIFSLCVARMIFDRPISFIFSAPFLIAAGLKRILTSHGYLSTWFELDQYKLVCHFKYSTKEIDLLKISSVLLSGSIIMLVDTAGHPVLMINSAFYSPILWNNLEARHRQALNHSNCSVLE